MSRHFERIRRYFRKGLYTREQLAALEAKGVITLAERLKISKKTVYKHFPDKESLALALYDAGCDIVFQVASRTGEGVFEAAAERGLYAIGVDSDQKYIADDVIVCSMCKQVGESIYQAIKQYQKEGDACTLWGTTWVADMASGLVGIGYGEEGSQQQVSDELKSEVDGLAKKIIDGEIVVDTTR